MTNSRKVCRSGDRCDARSLADVLYCMVHHSDVDASSVAEKIGVRRGYLLDASNPDRVDTQFQARLIAPITQATGNDSLIKHLARECGGVFFQLPAVESTDHADVNNQTTTMIGATGDMLSELRNALADQHLSVEEAERVKKKAHDSVAETVRLVALLDLKATPAPALRKVQIA